MIFKKIKNSFKYAWTGFIFFIKERNIKIHLLVALLVIILGIVLSINTLEWALITISIMVVISLEIINTVIENIFDLFHPEKDGRIMIIKDLAAAAVFVSAIGAVIIGLIIFLPLIFQRLQ